MMLADLPPPDLSMLPPMPPQPLPPFNQSRTRAASTPARGGGWNPQSSPSPSIASDPDEISEEQLAEWAIKSGLAGFLPSHTPSPQPAPVVPVRAPLPPAASGGGSLPDPRLSILGAPPPPPPGVPQVSTATTTATIASTTTATTTATVTRKKPMGAIATPFAALMMNSSPAVPLRDADNGAQQCVAVNAQSGSTPEPECAAAGVGVGAIACSAPVITMPRLRRHSVEVGSLSSATGNAFQSKFQQQKQQGPELFGIAEEWSAEGERTFSYKEKASSTSESNLSSSPSSSSSSSSSSSKPHKKDKQRRWSLRKALSRSSGSVDLDPSSSGSKPRSMSLAPLQEDEELAIGGIGSLAIDEPLIDEEELKKAEASLATLKSSTSKSSTLTSSDKSKAGGENMGTIKMLRRRSTGFLNFNKKDKKEKAEEAKLRARFEQEEKQHKHSGWQFIDSEPVNDDLWKDQEYSA